MMRRLPRVATIRSFYVCGILLGIVFPLAVSAGQFSYQRDLIVDSAPGATTTHEIIFTTPTALSFGDQVRLTFEDSSGAPFIFPVGFDYTDIDISYATSGAPGVYIDRQLGNELASTTADYVAFSTVGGSTYLTLVLGDSIAGSIPADSEFLLRMGTNASYQTSGDESIENPANSGSYRIVIESFTPLGAMIDYGAAMIAVLPRVSVGPVDTTDSIPPTVYDGRPFASSTLLGNTVTVQISVRTDKLATCRYDSTPNIDYQSKTATMTSLSLGLLHYFNLNPTANTSYFYYIRCQNSSKYPTTVDYPIYFDVGAVPTPGGNTGNSGQTTSGPVAGPQGASSFSGPGPAGGPYLGSGEVTLDGEAFPGATIVYLKDGKVAAEESVDSLGRFTKKFSGLDRGTYTWGVYAKDPKEKNSSTYSSTIYLIAQTNNIIAPIYVSPTITSTTTIGVGENYTVEGYAIPRKSVQVVITKQGNAESGKIITATTTADGAGKYRIELSTASLGKGTYEVKAQSIVTSKDPTLFSPVLFLGIGESPNVDFSSRSDLNKDGKVNLVDFSILLFNWRTSDAVADINLDGTVNLTDFSIMLSNWTG